MIYDDISHLVPHDEIAEYLGIKPRDAVLMYQACHIKIDLVIYKPKHIGIDGNFFATKVHLDELKKVIEGRDIRDFYTPIEKIK